MHLDTARALLARLLADFALRSHSGQVHYDRILISFSAKHKCTGRALMPTRLPIVSCWLALFITSTGGGPSDRNRTVGCVASGVRVPVDRPCNVTLYAINYCARPRNLV